MALFTENDRKMMAFGVAMTALMDIMHMGDGKTARDGVQLCDAIAVARRAIDYVEKMTDGATEGGTWK